MVKRRRVVKRGENQGQNMPKSSKYGFYTYMTYGISPFFGYEGWNLALKFFEINPSKMEFNCQIWN
jgi:hypothetical protein